MMHRAKELLETGRVTRVLGWRQGDFANLTQPAFFTTTEQLDNLVYNEFCAANLSKYLIANAQQDGVTLVFLKPCDTYSFNLLLKEQRIIREQVYVIGVTCNGKADFESDEELLERCRVCTKTEHLVYDELIGQTDATREANDRFKQVLELEAEDSDARYAFWQAELSRCIRCNACRNICPSCHCKSCVFDNNKYDVQQKANATSFEEQMFHIIRAYHVAGRCTDCGECSRACPQKIKLELLNRKFIKDINEFYGEYQAGADLTTLAPLASFDAHNDKEVGDLC